MNIENSTLPPLLAPLDSAELLPSQVDSLNTQAFSNTFIENLQNLNITADVERIESPVTAQNTMVTDELMTLTEERNVLNKLQNIAGFEAQALPHTEQAEMNALEHSDLIMAELNQLQHGEGIVDLAAAETAMQPMGSETVSLDEIDLESIDLENTLGALNQVMQTLEPFDKTSPIFSAQDVLASARKANLINPQAHQATTQINAAATAELDSPEELLSKLGIHLEENTVNPIELSKQPNIKVGELAQHKETAKFSIEMANLNRAVLPAVEAHNKIEVPAMTKHFAHPEWDQELGTRVIWMQKQAIPSAELRLNPQHLGPVSIKIDVDQDQVTVAFSAQHAAVKEALEAAVPKLREMLSAQQLNLADVNVSQDDSRQKQAQDFQTGSGNSDNPQESTETADNTAVDSIVDIADEIEAGRAIASNGILSLFA